MFPGTKHLSESELRGIENQFERLAPLMENVAVAFKLVSREETSCRRGEYCILIYSEKKDQYLQNVGYMAEQLDLWLASKNIGACWYGMGKTKETQWRGLDFVIMIAIEKVEKTKFRKDYSNTKRKPLSEIWQGNGYPEIANVVRYAPSACNTQPWLVNAGQNRLEVYRVKGKRGMMPKKKVSFYNQIDIGIFLLFLELCLKHENKISNRELYSGELEESTEVLTAIYTIEE
ncbi:MAG: nitroreductase [Clostridiales bacterium]|nr:MAG: nitroreductase [Clostridiales bacterium]